MILHGCHFCMNFILAILQCTIYQYKYSYVICNYACMHAFQARSQGGFSRCGRTPLSNKRSTILPKRSIILFEKSQICCEKSTILLKKSTILLKRSSILLKRSTILYKRTTQLKFLAMGLDLSYVSSIVYLCFS